MQWGPCFEAAALMGGFMVNKVEASPSVTGCMLKVATRVLLVVSGMEKLLTL